MPRVISPLLVGWLVYFSGCSENSSVEAAPAQAESEPAAIGSEGSSAVDGDRPAGSVEPADPELAPDETDPIPRRTVEALGALGYAATEPTDNPEDRGVTTESDRAAPGLNLYSSRYRASALLTDLDGDVIHRWAAPETGRTWMHIEPLPNGDVLAITKDRDIARHDWDSNLVWRRVIRAHHDLAVRGDRIYALFRHRGVIARGERHLPTVTDGIAVLSLEDGEVLERHELLPLLHDHLDADRLDRLERRAADGESASVLARAGGIGDLLHTNSIAFLDRDIPGVAPAGSILLSFRAIDRVAIVDAGVTRVLWIWGRREIDGQHDATQLDDGNVLMFDNGIRHGRSRVIEVDPTAGEIVWSYDGSPLFSRLRGGAQALPGGHVLITESDRGHAIEVSRDGEVVWQFWNPDVRRGGPDGDERAVIYRLDRFPRSFFEPLSDEGQE